MVGSPGTPTGPSTLPDPMLAYRDRAIRDRNSIARLMAQIAESPWVRLAPPLNELEALAHGLAGTGGTFGFPALSDTAARVERLLERWRGAPPATLSRRRTAHLRRLVERMSAELDIVADGRG
jgi:HPt (histidine-containing phosphotransfer) domain-containing protein